MLAQSAILEGKIAALNLLFEIRGIKRKLKYKYKDYSYLLPLGQKYTLAKFSKIILKGKLGWFLRGIIDFNYLLKILPFYQALKIWLKGLFMFVSNKNLG
jgi:NADH dehydrogenase FAD-containing subunit